MSDGGGDGGGGWVELEKAAVTRSSHQEIPRISHYYGDVSRQLLVAAAATMLIGSPIYGDSLRLQFPFIVTGTLILVAFAALTNPRYMWVSIGSSVASGVGVLAYGMWSMIGYTSENPIAFVLRMAIAIVFLFAFYYSLKTVRSFTLHQIGKRDSVDEFESEEEKRRADKLERSTTIHPDLTS